ncbi:ATPase [Methylobacterium sp. Leaf123]|uniref:sensor histidine kinase n=1 Tax=Methylobacterium sp. Leaf123 TaxID=1736264 RepID=UPI0006F3A7A7|nr:HAMP domain-containing sensor histidine kinase [Methylobacterium sp. Leaf123]KQQ18201.1 ATPase [Methylobacterium sp. Leaf123]
MNSGSLRLRLGLAAAGLIALALVLAGIGLTLIFDQVLDARTADGLDRTAKLIAGQVALAPDGAPTLPREPPDSRFSTPYGGLYWQVERAGGTALRSRSLWDRSLGTLPDTSEEPAVGDLAGPDGGRLIAVTRRVTIPGNGAPVALAVTVAEDRRDLAQSRATFLRLLVPSLGALFAALTLAMSLFVRRALAPFRTLRADLAAIHAGRQARLPETFPEEVRPLVADLNRLLDAQERDLERARTGAGDMAHGLKTPLAVLDALARRTETVDPALAAEIAEQAQAMGRQVERTLARARAASGGLRRRACPVAPATARIVGALKRLPEGEALRWEIAIPENLAFPGDEGDLTEILGNLLDNARKWAHRRIRVSGRAAGGEHGLVLEDDGPGMSAAAIAGIARGRRWDETRPGTGFGIAIARDLAEGVGARMHLSRSELGGLRVELRWPVPAA